MTQHPKTPFQYKTYGILLLLITALLLIALAGIRWLFPISTAEPIKYIENQVLIDAPEHRQAHPITTITVQANDTLSQILSRLHVPYQQQQALLKAMPTKLHTLHPGQKLLFQLEHQHIKTMQYPLDAIEYWEASFDQQNIQTSIKSHPTSTALLFKSITIHSSLAAAAQDTDLPTYLISDVEKIFGNNVHFARDIRPGDELNILYEEVYVGSERVGRAHVMAAELINKGKTYRAVRYTYPKDHTGYYTLNGKGTGLGYLRFPVEYTRISSGFSYHRLDPIVHKVQPHLGIDLAAPTGTPIKTIGDGVVAFIGTNGGYGKTVIIKHSTHLKTLYGHMSRFAHLKRGEHVHKGQLIGYVGSTGWATGPHLHYGVYINGVPKNPLTTHLPQTPSIPSAYTKQYQNHANKVWTLLQDNITQQTTGNHS